MAVQKTPEETFQTEWNKAAAWAQSQGISASSYTPVYQLDAQRIQSGEYPMSAAERNRAILAAANPNDVTPLPTDKPSASSVWGNSVSDLRSIATGLEPQHLISNLFDTVVNTAKDIVNPKRLVGANVEDTAANLLQDTLLSFVPGAYDVGSVLRGGTDSLAEHPLVALLDLLPVGSSKMLTGALAGTDAGAHLAELAGLPSTDALKEQSLQKTITNVLMNHVTKNAPTGIGPAVTDAGIHQLSIGERMQASLGKSRLIQTNKPIQELMNEFQLNNQLASSIRENVVAPFTHALEGLNPEERGLFDYYYLQLRFGKDDIERILHDPTIPLSVTNAMREAYQVIRFETEEAILAAPRVRGQTVDVAPIIKPDNTTGLYAGKGADAVKNAKETLADARVAFTIGSDATLHLHQNVSLLDAQLPQLAQGLDAANQAARKAAESSDTMHTNVVKNEGGVQQRLGTQRDQASYMFGQGGVIDGMLEAVKAGDVDRLTVMSKVVSSRLDSWGANSVDAKADPAFQAVKAAVDKIDQWAKGRKSLDNEIDKRINGPEAGEKIDAEVRRQQALQKELQNRQTTQMTDNQKAEREGQSTSRKRAISKIKADLQVRTGEIQQLQALQDAEDIARGDNAALRATPAKTKEIIREVKATIAARKKEVDKQIADEGKKADAKIASKNSDWDKKAGALSQRQKDERAAMSAVHRAEMKSVGGELKQQMREFAKALDDFHQAVWDHPSDEYRDLEQSVYERNLIEGDHNAELVDASMSRLQGLGWDDTRLEQLRSDPARLQEYVGLTVKDIYENPLNFDPDLYSVVKQAREEATKSAVTEVNTLMAQGFRPIWLPSAGPEDRISSAIKVTVGKGMPHVDVAHERAKLPTNTRYDVVLGLSKATAQRVRRDATIDFVENSIVPRTITGDDLRNQLDAMHYGPLEGFDPNAEKLGSAYTMELQRVGLTKVDPQAMFGFSFPRWEGKALYMPTSLVRALEKVMEEERRGDSGIFDKGTRLFRYSILGLSPRYTAHILFGGTFLLALRSSVRAPTLILDAARALKDGSLPEQIFRTPTQEGFSRLTAGLTEHAEQSGKQMANLAIQEHLSVRQAVKAGAAKPIQILKAAADLNFRFTRHVVKMQTAVAYLDYAASAERRGWFTDAVTGERTQMTRERAMVEGMQHVEEVFGNLRSMSPLERQLAKNIMPFYGWTRHILNYVMSFPADHPWRAMTLSLMAFENSEAVPKGLPERIQFLFFLGSPDSQGNVSAIDTRFMDPLRDIGNYATLGGWLQALNPALLAPLAIMNPSAVYGSQTLYPNVTYDQFYGIETAANQGNIVTGLEQFVPQLGAIGSAMQAASQYRSQIVSNPNAFYKSLFESLNIPMFQVQKINVKQIAAHDEIARYNVAKQAAANAFQSGDFSSLKGYSSVPNPLNPDYDISPGQLQAVYNAALQEYPGTAPIEVLTPPPTPIGY